MELRVRKLFKPLAHLLALMLESRKSSIKTVVALSYALALALAAIFYLSFNFVIPFTSIAVALGTFFSALFDEVLRELSLMRKRLAAGEKAMLILDRYTDAIIIFGALYYLGDRSYALADFSLSVALEEHMLLGIALFLGAVLLEATNRMVIKDRLSYGFETRAERMFVLSLFLAAGLYFALFEEALFIGIAALALLIYLSALGNLLKIYAPELSRVFSGASKLFRSGAEVMVGLFSAIYSGITALLSTALAARKSEAQEPAAAEEAGKALEEKREEASYSFTVVAMDEKLEKPLANARVSIQNKETGKLETRHTDSYGRSDFRVAEGQYKILVAAEGFHEEEYERYIALDSGEIFALSKHSIDLSVTVSDAASSKPVKGASVRLVRSGEEKLKETDNLGAAYFENLEAGEYSVTAEAQGYEAREERVEVRGEKMLAVNLNRLAEAETTPQRKSRKKKIEPIEGNIEELEEMLEEKKERAAAGEQEISEPGAASMLVEHASADRIEDAVLEIAREYLGGGGEVFIIAAHPRVSSYAKSLAVEIKDARARVINLTTSSASLPAEKILELPMTNLEYFKAVVEEMPPKSMLIFEPISVLILNVGYGAAYKFLSEAIEQLSKKGHFFVGFLNREAHEQKELASVRNLFANLAEVAEGKLKKVK